MKKRFIKIICLIVIFSLNLTGILSIGRTIAFFNDTEESENNTYQAGIVDFVLSSPSDFTPASISLGESSTRTINFLNNNNIPKYKVKPVNFSGGLCDYLMLSASLDGTDVGYTGYLKDFEHGPVVFEPSEIWTFTLTFPEDAPEEAQGQTCNFDFSFYGSQIKNDLPFGTGFSDIEENISNIASEYCFTVETRSKGYWKNHEQVYIPHLPQYLGCQSTNPDCVGGNEEVGTETEVFSILQTDYAFSMRNRLRGQLLTMKLNVAHFGVGEYFINGVDKTINEIINDADSLLRLEPSPSDLTLENSKDLLESLVDLQLNVCSLIFTSSFESELSSPPSEKVVLNEFLPNPEGFEYGYDFGDDSSFMPQGEWVELYNKNEIGYDLDGWYIWDDSTDISNKVFITGSNTYPARTIILGESWLVVYMNKALFDNTGDTVKLFDNYNNLIDTYTYTIGDNACDLEPTPGEENDSTETGSCSTIPPNKSYARIPDGSGAWVDPIPTPGMANTLDNRNIEMVVPEFNESLVVEQKIEEPLSEGLIIIDELFLASPNIGFSEFETEEEIPNTPEETTNEILINEEIQVFDNIPFFEEIIQETTQDFTEIPIETTEENPIEPVVEEVLNEIEEPIVLPEPIETVDETEELIMSPEPVVEEVINETEEVIILPEPIVEEIINETEEPIVLPEPIETVNEIEEPIVLPEPIVEEVQVLPEPEPIIENNTQENE